MHPPLSRKCVEVLRQGSSNDHPLSDPDNHTGKAGGGAASEASGKKGKKRKSQEGDQEASSSSSASGPGLASEGGDDEDAAATRLSDLPALTAHTLNGCCYAAVQFALAFASPQVHGLGLGLGLGLGVSTASLCSCVLSGRMYRNVCA